MDYVLYQTFQGCHGDLTSDEQQILLAEFSLRHSKNATRVANEYAKRNGSASSSTEFLF